MSNSGVYFITCEFLGRRFVKIGRSTNIARRRSQLQSGCPFRLKVEHIEVMSESEAVVKEKQWHAMFKDMRKRCESFNAISDDVNPQFMFHCPPYENDIEAFIERRKARDSATELDDDDAPDHQEQLLF
ncbi:GIY-YIG nuclease family protein [Rhodopirellula europaea]|uniref:Protein containing Putative helicase A859L domain protein n=1 Tax=Rhodopirellula europaea 6C TaxID=1263867 RepID=M2A3B2_9BACT|nr:GIY-YIG nuclease family protein [Rhodopirellula europaea]EMB13446.1 protein containing Putative helicase A859L domain protein [Rhodopirellula europaea 6C]